MSTYEKISLVVIGLLLVLMVIFSYREFKEPPERAASGQLGSGFDQSVGQNFKIGAFATAVSERSSGGPEDNCDALRPVIIGTLHDIKERLEHAQAYTGEGAFEVNEHALQLLCNKNAELVLTDGSGNDLRLEKVPFVRAVPPQGTADDVGTRVRINATVTSAGVGAPTRFSTFGEELIPDRFLDTATSTSF